MMNVKHKSRAVRITAAAVALVILAGGISLTAYRYNSHKEYTQFISTDADPIRQRIGIGTNGKAASYASVTKSELLTGRFEYYTNEKGNTFSINFRGDLPPDGENYEALYRYEGVNADYYAELYCIVNIDGSRSYEVLLSETSGFDPIWIKIAPDGSFTYPEHDDIKMTPDNIETVNKNRDQILELKSDFDKEVFGE